MDYDPHAFPPFAVTVDVVVLTLVDGRLHVVLVKRGVEPFKGDWALPGGFVRVDEDLATAAARELAEETGLGHPAPFLEQFGVYGDPGRDPRMRVISVGYVAVVPRVEEPQGGSDAAESFLAPVDEVDPASLAFDHRHILEDAIDRARTALERSTIATRFCPAEFTVAELREVYEAVWGVELDPGNFQKRVADVDGFLEPTGRHRRGGRGRPPELYRAGPASVIEPPMRRP